MIQKSIRKVSKLTLDRQAIRHLRILRRKHWARCRVQPPTTRAASAKIIAVYHADHENDLPPAHTHNLDLWAGFPFIHPNYNSLSGALFGDQIWE